MCAWCLSRMCGASKSDTRVSLLSVCFLSFFLLSFRSTAELGGHYQHNMLTIFVKHLFPWLLKAPTTVPRRQIHT